MTPQIQGIVQECKNQAESCLYTSTSLFIWLRSARRSNRIWNALPIILGAAASFVAFKESYPYIAAFMALLAGVLPSIYEELKLKEHTEDIESQAGQYKNLQDRFRQAAEITALDSNLENLKAEFSSLMRQMEDLRARPITAPEWCFVEARKKIQAGHYDFDAASQ